MKRILALAMTLSMLLCLAACGSTASTTAEEKSAAGQTTAEPTAVLTEEPAAETAPAETTAPSRTEGNTAAYQSFLQGYSTLTVDAIMEELAQGSQLTLTGLQDAFLAGLKETMGFENAVCTATQAAYIDCGNDGIPELALRLTEDTQDMGELMEDFVIRSADDGLHLVAAFTTFYRTASTLYNTGLAESGGSNSAFSSGNDYYYINAEGQLNFLYHTDTYVGLDEPVIPQDAVPTSLWDSFSSPEYSGMGNITLTVYNFTNDLSDYDAYIQQNLYVFTDESTGDDAEVDADTASLYESLGLQVLPFSHVYMQIEQAYANAGITDGGNSVEDLQPVQWQELSALIG